MKSLPRAAKVIWLVAACIVLSLGLAVTAIIRQLERETDVATKRQVEQFARFSEAALNRSLLSIDLMLAGLDRSPALSGVGLAHFNPELADKALKALMNQSLLVNDLQVLDVNGRSLTGAKSNAATQLNEIPVALLFDVQHQVAPQLTVHPPVVNFRSGEQVLLFARAFTRADGIRAISLAQVPVSTLATVLAPAADLAGVSITLENVDGYLMASVPPNDPMIGKRLRRPLGESLRINGQRLDTGHLGLARLTDTPAYLSVRPTVYRNLQVAVSLSKDHAESEILSDQKQIAGIGILFFLIIAGVATLAHVHVLRLQSARADADASKLILQEALSSLHEGFLLWDIDQKIIAWNPAYLEFFPHLRSVIGKGVSCYTLAQAGANAVIPNASDEEKRRWIAERLTRPGNAPREFELQLANGRIICSNQQRTQSGCEVAIYRDVTQVRAATLELLKSKQTAETANLAKSEFLSSMSHELRTPMNAMLGFAQLIESDPRLSTDNKDNIGEVLMAGRHLLLLINDLLDLAKIEAGHVALELADIMSTQFAEECIALVRPMARQRQLKLHCEVEPLLFRSDRRLLKQVVLNLLSNAVKYNRPQGEIRLALNRDGAGHIEISVSDTGQGIERRRLPELFQPFNRLGAENSDIEGHGIGLAVCARLMQALGGSIQVHSDTGTGSQFTVRFPLTWGNTAQDPAALSGAPALAIDVSATILNVDDNDANRRLVRSILAAQPHLKLLEAVSAERGIELARQHAPDLILMDIHMLGMNGIEALQCLRRDRLTWSIPVVALSADMMLVDLQRIQAAGFDAHLGKPFELPKFLATLQALIHQPRRAPRIAVQPKSPTTARPQPAASEAL